MTPRFLFALLLFTAGPGIHAQLVRQLPLAARTQIDTLSIRESSFLLKAGNDTLAPGIYTLHWAQATLLMDTVAFLKKYPHRPPLTVSYRTWPYFFGQAVQRIRISGDSSKQALPFTFSFPDETTDESIFITDGLEKNGSISRGIAFGNAQSLALNSALNVQLSGKLAENVEIQAAISDENVPLQPEGTTQRIQDFDRVFIQLSVDKQKVTAGDFIINRPQSYFLNFLKKGQGLQLQTRFDNKNIFKKNAPAGALQLQASGAIARGKFAQNRIQGIEGNQGPYRLRGNEGESFIVVLSGTERVYIDGKQLVRGRENDYVIDYNTAELTFTARQLITKDRRIVVEFEYSDRNYGRLMYHVNNEWQLGKAWYRVNVFAEQDLKNQPLQQPLSPEQRQLLAAAGDSLQNAVSPSFSNVGFNINEVLYKRKDSLVNGIVTPVFIYSTSPDSAHYRVFFSQTAAGSGDYVLERSSANGRVYRYTGPNTGDYIAAVQLIAPRLQRMATFAAGWDISKEFSIEAEAALSTQDKNTFSPLDNNDNNGYAYRVKLNWLKPFGRGEKKANTLRTTLLYEQVEKTFTPIVRWRSVEFDRDLNLSSLRPQGNEYIPSLEIELNTKNRSRIFYSGGAFIKGSSYTALRNQLQASVNTRGWFLDFWGSAQFTRGDMETRFLRHRTRFYKTINRQLRIGLNGEDEYNIFRKDSLLGNSYMFNDWELYLGSSDTSKLSWKVYYRPRADHRALSNALVFAGIGHNMGAEAQAVIRKNHSLKLLFNYRSLQIRDSLLLPGQKNDQSTTARVEYNSRFLKQSITLNTYYEIGSGLENKREYSFLQVTNGQGTHFWDASLDYNGNGVPDLDEFQEAQFNGQGNYIKILIPSLEYVKTYNTQFNQSINLRFPVKWRNGKTWQKVLSLFSNQTVYRLSRKSQNANIGSVISPFSASWADSALLSLAYSLRNTFYINRNEGKFGVDIEYRDLRNRSLLTNGIDSRSQESWEVRSRYNISRLFTLTALFEKGHKRYSSEFLRTRDYNLELARTETKFTVQKDTRWRIAFLYGFQYKRNGNNSSNPVNPGGEMAHIHQGGIESTVNFLNQGVLTLQFKLHNILYNSPLNNNLAFEMLGGLGNGINGTWSANFQRNIGNNMQAGITYEGRAGQAISPLHVAGMQVRAFF